MITDDGDRVCSEHIDKQLNDIEHDAATGFKRTVRTVMSASYSSAEPKAPRVRPGQEGFGRLSQEDREPTSASRSIVRGVCQGKSGNVH